MNAKVINVDKENKTIEVNVHFGENCSTCQSKGHCSTSKKIENLTIPLIDENPVSIGDNIDIDADPKSRIYSALLFFLMPLLMLLLSYLCIFHILENENTAMIVSIVSFFASFIPVYYLSKLPFFQKNSMYKKI